LLQGASLLAGKTAGRHTTGKNEETRFISHGRGDALLGGERSYLCSANRGHI